MPLWLLCQEGVWRSLENPAGQPGAAEHLVSRLAAGMERQRGNRNERVVGCVCEAGLDGGSSRLDAGRREGQQMAQMI